MRRCWSTMMITAAALTAVGGMVAAQETGSPLSGPVTLDYTKGAVYLGSKATITGDVRLNSSAFGAQAETVLIDLRTGEKGKQNFGIARATLEPALGRQVSGHFEDVAQGRGYKFRADHAVYVPDAARVNGGKIDLTGHVEIAVSALVALDGPLLTRTEHAVVLLGPSPQYPQVETGAGHVTFTPLNGGQ